MDFATQYCPKRKLLEENAWVLVSRLSALTSRLMGLVGKDHRTFAITRIACSAAKTDIVAVRRRLDLHRSAHGC